MIENKNSPHILNTAATLLGLCFVVLTSLNLNNQSEETTVDELTAVAILLFMNSCIFSFQAIRTKKTGTLFERIADISFLIGLFVLAAITLLIVFNIIK